VRVRNAGAAGPHRNAPHRGVRWCGPSGPNPTSSEVPAATRFEDLIAWQKARQLGQAVAHLTASPLWREDLRLRSQLRAAAASVMANIAEGFGRVGRAEFRRYLSIAMGSAAEVRSHAHFARDAGLLSEEEHRRLVALAVEVTRVVTRLRSATRGPGV